MINVYSIYKSIAILAVGWVLYGLSYLMQLYDLIYITLIYIWSASQPWNRNNIYPVFGYFICMQDLTNNSMINTEDKRLQWIIRYLGTKEDNKILIPYTTLVYFYPSDYTLHIACEKIASKERINKCSIDLKTKKYQDGESIKFGMVNILYNSNNATIKKDRRLLLNTWCDDDSDS